MSERLDEGPPGGRYRGTDGRLHDAWGNTIYEGPERRKFKRGAYLSEREKLGWRLREAREEVDRIAPANLEV